MQKAEKSYTLNNINIVNPVAWAYGPNMKVSVDDWTATCEVWWVGAFTGTYVGNFAFFRNTGYAWEPQWNMNHGYKYDITRTYYSDHSVWSGSWKVQPTFYYNNEPYIYPPLSFNV